MKIYTPNDLSPEDYKYVVEGGDPGFNPEYNRWVMNETIRINDERAKKNKKEYLDRLGERVHAVAMYMRHVYEGKSTTVEKYLGRNYLAHLRGDDIRTTVAAKISEKAWKNAKKINRSPIG